MSVVGEEKGKELPPGALPAICAELKMHASDGVPIVNSRDVAEMFEKHHHHVLRDIETHLAHPNLDGRYWFRPVAYVDAQAKPRRSFDLTRDGFTLLVMAWTGEKAMTFKVRYIEAFNAMEQSLRESAPVTERAHLHAVRELVSTLSVRFDSQDKEIGEIKNGVSDLNTRLTALERKSKKRVRISDATKAEHVDAIARLGGRCPCCGIRSAVVAGQRLPPAEFDHFYDNSLAGPDDTWLICKVCHDQFSHGKVARHQRETQFKSYQELRRSLTGRQIALSLF